MRRGLVHFSVPIPGLIHLEATVIQVMLVGRPVKILAAYLSSSRPLIGRTWPRVSTEGSDSVGRRPERQTRG